MESDTKRILLQMLETMLEQQQMLEDMAHGNKALIGALEDRYRAEYLPVVLEAARAINDSVPRIN